MLVKNINFIFINNKVNVEINFYLYFINTANIDEQHIAQCANDNIKTLHMFYTVDADSVDTYNDSIASVTQKYSGEFVKFTEKVFVVLSTFNISDQRNVDIMTKNFEIIRYLSDNFLV